MLAFRISPERGSLTLGPEAVSVVDGSHRIVELRASSRSKSALSVGATRATIALLKPAARNTGSHISTPLISHARQVAAVADQGRRGIDPPDDRLDRIGHGRTRILGLEAEALDEAAARTEPAGLVEVLARRT